MKIMHLKLNLKFCICLRFQLFSDEENDFEEEYLRKEKRVSLAFSQEKKIVLSKVGTTESQTEGWTRAVDEVFDEETSLSLSQGPKLITVPNIVVNKNLEIKNLSIMKQVTKNKIFIAQ